MRECNFWHNKNVNICDGGNDSPPRPSSEERLVASQLPAAGILPAPGSSPLRSVSVADLLHPRSCLSSGSPHPTGQGRVTLIDPSTGRAPIVLPDPPWAASVCHACFSPPLSTGVLPEAPAMNILHPRPHVTIPFPETQPIMAFQSKMIFLFLCGKDANLNLF